MTPSEFRAARKRLGMTRAALAKALGVSPKTISNWAWERAAIPPFLALALKWLEHEAQKDV